MPNQVQQALRGEQALNPNQITGHDMDPVFARVHVLDLALLGFNETIRRSDPYLAATATATQVAAPQSAEFDATMTRQGPEYAAAAAVQSAGPVPASPEVQAYAAAQAAAAAPMPAPETFQGA